MDMKLVDIVAPSCVQLNLKVDNKREVLTKLVDVLAATGEVKDRDELLRVILDREKLMSTGIGNGVALPHGKTNTVDKSIAAIATLATPIDFDSLDDKPVQIILLLVGTDDNVGAHLRLLSRISRTVGSEQFRSSLIATHNVDDALSLFAASEEERA